MIRKFIGFISITLLLIFCKNNLKAQITADIFTNCKIELSVLSDKNKNRYAPTFFNRGILFAQDEIDGKTGTGTKLMFSRLSRSYGYKKPTTFLEDEELYKNVGPACSEEKSTKVYFTANHPKKFVLMNNDGVYKLAIYEMNVAKKKAKLMFFNEKEYNFMHPTVSNDDRFMVFSTDKDSGAGDSNLYFSLKYGKTWTTPEPFGEEVINSSGKDVFPGIIDENTVIFASDRPDGYGKLDLYITTRIKKDEWTPPVNLGPSINSEADDFGLILDLETGKGMFTSKRQGGVDRLYDFKVTLPKE